MGEAAAPPAAPPKGSPRTLPLQDAFARGEVFIGSGDNGYTVKEGLPPGTPGSGSWQYGITIVTPDRDFLFICETERQRQEWMSVFNGVMAQQMSPQEYTVEAYFKHRR
ncbi:arf-GAP with dual PH domain-containing protein 1-like [Rhinoraja longicauda]